MITTRAPQYAHSPPSPTWLDPESLGVTTLRRVGRDACYVIKGGPVELRTYLRRLDPPPFPVWEAYALVRHNKGGAYVFSKEQFWIAAYLFNKWERRQEDWPLAYDYALRNALDLSPEEWQSFAQQAENRLWQLRRTISEEKICQFFDIQDCSACEELQPNESPTRPGLRRDARGELVEVHVPDTTHLGVISWQSWARGGTGPFAFGGAVPVGGVAPVGGASPAGAAPVDGVASVG